MVMRSPPWAGLHPRIAEPAGWRNASCRNRPEMIKFACWGSDIGEYGDVGNPHVSAYIKGLLTWLPSQWNDQGMKSEFTLAFNEIAEHSKLKREIILDALENAMVTAYRKSVNASQAQHVVAKIDPATGAIRVFAEKEVVESVQEANTEVALEDARQVDPEANLGDMVTMESTPKDFGRIAAQAAKQVIVQKIREAERESQYQEYSQREGEIIVGVV